MEFVAWGRKNTQVLNWKASIARVYSGSGVQNRVDLTGTLYTTAHKNELVHSSILTSILTSTVAFFFFASCQIAQMGLKLMIPLLEPPGCGRRRPHPPLKSTAMVPIA